MFPRQSTAQVMYCCRMVWQDWWVPAQAVAKAKQTVNSWWQQQQQQQQHQQQQQQLEHIQPQPRPQAQEHAMRVCNMRSVHGDWTSWSSDHIWWFKHRNHIRNASHLFSSKALMLSSSPLLISDFAACFTSS